MSSGNGVSRRDALRVGGLAALGLALGGCSTGPKQVAVRAPKRVMRVAHLTDFHVQPERAGAEGMAACLRHCMGLKDRPSLVVTGGDLIMDAFDKDAARTKLQWDIFTRAMKDECGVPVHHTLGNHDIWGWNKDQSKTTGNEPKWGKKWALDTLGMERAYYGTDAGHWRLVVLDSVQPHPDGYVGGIDAEQFAWLDGELAAHANRPVMVVTHIAVFAPSAALYNNKLENGNRVIYSSLMMANAHKVGGLFKKHGNVKLCLQGHMHRNDRAELDGTTYITSGAVCGAWWKGPEGQCTEGYGVVDLFDDGSFVHGYETYGWVAREA